MDTPTDVASISSAEYFSTTFGVDAATAASLAQQVAAGGTRGVGLAPLPPAFVPPGGAPASATPAAPPAGAPATLSARAEYDQLMSDRASGKMTTAQWNATGAARERALADIIAQGGGNAPAPNVAQQQADPMAEVFAPPASASDYRFPYAETPTDEALALDRQVAQAMHAAQLPRSAVESILSNVVSASRAIAAIPEDQRGAALQARLDSNKVRMTEMWAKEGIDFDTAVYTIDLEVARWPQVLQEHFRKLGPFLGPLDWDSVLQLAKYRNRTRAA
jgi:hypothetical protein